MREAEGDVADCEEEEVEHEERSKNYMLNFLKFRSLHVKCKVNNLS